MKAELIAIGSELLEGDRRDTNGDWLAERLWCHGVEVVGRASVPDDAERIASAVDEALRRSELVVVTGGLGPTEDDLTREGVAAALGVRLVQDDERLDSLRRRFAAFTKRFGSEQARQALRPQGAEWIDNPLGSAPGFRFRRRGHSLFVFPGVSAEMMAMVESTLLPQLAASGGQVRRTLKIAGRTESSVDRQLADLYRDERVAVTILSGVNGLELRLRASAEHAPALEGLEREVRSRLGRDLFGADRDTLPQVVGDLLFRHGLTLATAESCTGGMIGATLTGVPGSSAWYRGGVIVYSDELKSELAGVDPQTIAAQGAVSEAVARELARGARERGRASIGFGVTGIAGPGGGSADKPVGTVHLALDDGRVREHWRVLLPGDRELVRGRSVTLALDRVRRHLLAREEP